jgi:hypothetical protein
LIWVFNQPGAKKTNHPGKKTEHVIDPCSPANVVEAGILGSELDAMCQVLRTPQVAGYVYIYIDIYIWAYARQPARGPLEGKGS